MQLAMFCAILLLSAQNPRPAEPKSPPKGWPPIPTFKTTIDYVQWWEEQYNKGITDDARISWKLLGETPENAEANALLWGKDSNGVIPGLLTGEAPPPERYAWNPKEHRNWESAYQLQVQQELPKKLIEAASHRQLSTRMDWSQLANYEQAGFTRSDRLLTIGLQTELYTPRLAVKVLLQNAWRSPDGKTDSNSMKQAILTGLNIRNQLQSSGGMTMRLMVACSVQKLVGENVLQALNEGVLSPTHIVEIDQWLKDHDNRSFDAIAIEADQARSICETAQFAYLPKDGTWQQPPQPNPDNVKKLEALSKMMNQAAKQLPGVIPQRPDADLSEAIKQHDPVAGIKRAVEYHMQSLEINRKQLPWQAMIEKRALWKQYSANTLSHPIALLFDDDLSHGAMIVAQCETGRRAMRIVLALHQHKNQTGAWPASLEKIAPALPKTVLTDPFSGKPFVYRLANGQPILYSAGYNAKDDGGKPLPYSQQEKEADGKPIAAEADYVYWPVQKEK